MGGSGPKYQYYYSIWALNPYYLGPWTLRSRKKYWTSFIIEAPQEVFWETPFIED